MSWLSIIPKPFRNILVVNSKGKISVDQDLLNNDETRLPIYRAALAVAGFAAAYLFNLKKPTTLALGAFISMPTAALALGTWGLTAGLNSIIRSVTRKSFQSLTIGLTLVTIGWYGIENHDAYPIGLGESLYKSMHSKT